MAAVYPDDVYDDPSTWPRARRLDALAIDLVGSRGALADGRRKRRRRFSWIGSGAVRQGALAAYAAGPAALRAGAGDPREGARPRASRHGDEPQQPRRLLQAQGDLAGARPLFERALAIREKVLGPEHPDTATSLNNLASLLQAQGDLAGGAAALRARAGDLREGARPRASRDRREPQQPRQPASGPGRPRRRRGRSSSARWRSARRRSAPSIPTPRRASTTSPACFRPRATSPARGRSSSARWRSTRRRSAPSIPTTATSLNNLALLLQAQGDLAGARPLFERALAIREKALGPEHPDTATSLNNLAPLLQAQGDLAGARPLFERALAIREKALGPEHLERRSRARGHLEHGPRPGSEPTTVVPAFGDAGRCQAKSWPRQAAARLGVGAFSRRKRTSTFPLRSSQRSTLSAR